LIFLIEYDRNTGHLASMRTFDSSERQAASSARLELEIALMTEGRSREVVLLEADSEEALRKTHGRYFRDVRQMSDSIDKINKRPTSNS
jgi:hypothetical protein